jgi:hypothetical protein
MPLTSPILIAPAGGLHALRAEGGLAVARAADIPAVTTDAVRAAG